MEALYIIQAVLHNTAKYKTAITVSSELEYSSWVLLLLTGCVLMPTWHKMHYGKLLSEPKSDFRWCSTKCLPMKPCSLRVPTRSTRTTSQAAPSSTSRFGTSQVRSTSSTRPSTTRWSSEGRGLWYLSSTLRWGTKIKKAERKQTSVRTVVVRDSWSPPRTNIPQHKETNTRASGVKDQLHAKAIRTALSAFSK